MNKFKIGDKVMVKNSPLLSNRLIVVDGKVVDASYGNTIFEIAVAYDDLYMLYSNDNSLFDLIFIEHWLELVE